ncbi:MAG: hypothetical protein GAK30_03603 [Paracidovorax wautersii]|uniref:HTH cro/C1-type domain-containing protein n=1 Tax=Paracidovorax wautersii TaxID=1177982 RepID=A0A7V8FKR7_9BURK|nr:MAG: hypothetical protein GAK30_03603 [Paracidovorax wautersii]
MSSVVSKQPAGPDGAGTASSVSHNLREVVSRAGSVAEFCRQVGINRQQFNKYLAGSHAPSRRNLARIARHCGLTVEDMDRPADEFLRRLRQQEESAGATVAPAHFQTLAALARGCASDLKPFLGTYFRYHRSSIYAGSVLRAVTVIYQEGDCIRYVTVESMRVRDDHGNEDRCRFTYRGICYLLGQRLFMCDYERRQCNEMTTTILMPQFRTPIKYMLGLVAGIAATAYRQPFAARVAFHKLSDDPHVSRNTLRQAALIAPEDPSIPAAVRTYLGGDGVLLAAI